MEVRAMIILFVILFLALAMIAITFVAWGVWLVVPALCIFGIYKIIKVVVKKKDKPDLVIMSRKDFDQNYTKKVNTTT